MTITADLSYPVGRMEMPAAITPELRARAIEEIEALPAMMRQAVAGLDDGQLDTQYRPGGWTVRQVVHHVADSHMNAYIRMKLALTENSPTIKPYDEKTWADLPDMKMPVAPSLAILDGVHARWITQWRSLPSHDFARTFMHPEYPDAPRTLEWLAQHYAWHSRHHLAHITALRQRQGW